MDVTKTKCKAIGWSVVGIFFILILAAVYLFASTVGGPEIDLYGTTAITSTVIGWVAFVIAISTDFNEGVAGLGYMFYDPFFQRPVVEAFPEIKKWKENDTVKLYNVKVDTAVGSTKESILSTQYVGLTDEGTIVFKYRKYRRDPERLIELDMRWMMTHKWMNTDRRKAKLQNDQHRLRDAVDNSYMNEWVKEYQRTMREAENRLSERIAEPEPRGYHNKKRVRP